MRPGATARRSATSDPGSWTTMPTVSVRVAGSRPTRSHAARSIRPEARQPLVGQPEPGHVPGIRVARGQLEHPRPLGRDEDRQVGRAGGTRTASRAVTYWPSRSARPSRIKPADHRQRFLEPGHLVVGRVAERLVFRIVPAAPDAEDQPTAADVVERGGHLGQQRRVAECRAHDDRPELDAVGRLGDGAEDRPALVDPRRLAVRAGTAGGRRPRPNRDPRPPRPPRSRG